MALVKLLLVLTAFSFGQYEQIYGKISYMGGILDENGDLVIDFKKVKNGSTYEVKTKKITSYKKLKGGSKSDASFYAIPETGFDDLKTTQELNSSEYGCLSTSSAYYSGLYGLYGYAVLAHEGKDIAPSITWLVKMGPKKIIYKNVPEEYKTIYTDLDLVLTQTCSSIGFVWASLAINQGGFTDTTCFPNTKIPEDTTKCVDGSAITSYLKGYKSGSFMGKVNDVKEAILRFGPVWASPDLIIGWKDGNWIVAQPSFYGGDAYKLITVPIGADTQYVGQAMLDGVSAIRAALSVIAAAVVLPALTLFF